MVILTDGCRILSGIIMHLQISRSAYRNAFFVLLLLGFVIPMAPGLGDWTSMLDLLIWMLAIGCAFKWAFSFPPRATIEAPDILARMTGSYFERDGLCFAASLGVEEGLCWFRVLVQNRFDQVCNASIFYIPMEGVSEDGKPHEVPPVMLNIECGGGEVAELSIPYPIAAKWQGKIMIYDVAATTSYPNGEGMTIRSRRGLPVGQPTSENLELLKSAGILLLGHVRIARSASCEMTLPSGVAETLPSAEESQVRVRVIAEWESPAGGLPVQPMQ